MERKLLKSKHNKVLFGVCGGVGEYFEIDPVIIRILWVLISLAYGFGIFAYIIAAIVIPERKYDQWGGYNTQGGGEGTGPIKDNSSEWKEPAKFDPEKSRLVIGVGLIVLGVLFFAKTLFHWFHISYFWPVIFVAIGILIIYKGRGKSF